MMQLNKIHITTNRLIIRTLTLDDFNDLYRFVVDNAEMMVKTAPITLKSNPNLEASKQFLKTLEQDRIGGKWLWNCIIEKSTSKYTGHLQIVDINSKVRRAELGYIVDKTKYGNGYIPEATEAIIKHCFTEMNLNKLRLKIHVDNKASQRVAEKLEFEQCGLFKQEMATADDELLDMYIYEKLKEDWMKES